MVWGIPSLLPRDHEDTTLLNANIPILNPLFRINYPEWMSPQSVIKMPGDWYAEPWCYNIFTPCEPGFEISRYRVILNVDMTGGTIEKTVGFELVTGTKTDVDDFVESYHICHNQLIMCWSEGSVVKTYASRLSSNDSIYTGLIIKEQTGFIEDTLEMSLCPCSARLCLLSGYGSEVYIYDYRSPLCSNV